MDVPWADTSEFPRPLMMSRLGLRAIWAVDRFNDRINGSRRNARRGGDLGVVHPRNSRVKRPFPG